MTTNREDELRKELLDHWRFMLRHIKADKRQSEGAKLNTLLHAICCSIDGVSGQFEHSVDLVIDGVTINRDVMLHEELSEA